MAFTAKLEVANFNCKFGQLNLMDLADDIVIPSLLGDGIRRQVRQATYVLYRTQLQRFNFGSEEVVGISGEFIKDMFIQSSQVFEEEKGLLPNDQTLHTSPSAIFTLLLDPHILLYVRKSSDAPGMTSFGNTIEKLFNDRRDRLIRSVLAGIDTFSNVPLPARPVTAAKLRASLPKADLTVVPLMPDASLQDFILSLSLLTEVRYELFQTNNTTDFDTLFSETRTVSADTNARRAEIGLNNPEGLDKDAVAKQTQSAAAFGTSHINITGLDQNGNGVKGDTESLRIQSRYTGPTENANDAAASMVQQFNDLTSNGTLSPPQTDDDARRRSWEVFEQYFNNNDD